MLDLRQSWTYRRILNLLPILVLALLLLTVPRTAHAWGPIGHKTIARIAQQYISPKVHSRLKLYFGKDVALEKLAMWADDICDQRPETKPWHHLQIAPEATSFDIKRDCPKGNCITEKTREFVGIARLALRRKNELLEPIKFILHFGGDLPQPLHLGHPQNRNGKDIAVELNGQPMNLQEAWSTGILNLNGENDRELAERLIRRITPELERKSRNGLLQDWSWETHLVAIRVAYGSLPSGSPKILDEFYIHRAQSTIEDQLIKGGLRLAELLNRVWP